MLGGNDNYLTKCAPMRSRSRPHRLSHLAHICVKS